MYKKFCLTVALLTVAVASAADGNPGEVAYKTCAACHLPDGVGIPGAFPPIKNRAAAIAQLDGGREYLIGVVSFGLMGTIDVGGAQYFGVMAGNAAAMSAEDIAQVLNYITVELNDSDAVDIEAFTSDEVVGVQESVDNKSPQSAGVVRQRLVELHGEDWP